jgi:glycosyltransferase involved in cell wall biosynthesis
MPKSAFETVSVVIPLYNAEAFIADTIQSVLDQTLTDLKIYVIDDLSTDTSPEIVKKIAAKNPKVEYHLAPKKGGCPAPTKNVGIDLAQGTYIAFIDHDDWWEPTKLEKQVAYLEAHTEVNLVGCNVEIVDTDHNRSLGNFWTHPEELAHADLRRLAFEGPVFASTTCMIGRASFLKKHHFDTAYIGADEYDLSIHSLLDDAKQVVILPEVLAYWRWHSSSLSHSAQAAARSAKDEEHFAKKLLDRTDLTDEERDSVQKRLWSVRRIYANSLLAEGKRTEARKLYKDILAHSDSGDGLTKLVLVLDSIAPPLAQALIQFKKRYSYAKPVFR